MADFLNEFGNLSFFHQVMLIVWTVLIYRGIIHLLGWTLGYFWGTLKVAYMTQMHRGLKRLGILEDEQKEQNQES